MKKSDYKRFIYELQILDELNSKKEAGFKEFTRKAKLKNIKRIVAVSMSIASAVIAISFLVITQYSSSNKNQLTNAERNINAPTLILSSGETITLTSEQSNLSSVVSTKMKNLQASTQIAADSVVKYNTLIIPSCFTHRVTLSDGTEVLLNANSELKYPTEFNKNIRTVYLKGEAYFNVKKSDKQFVVHTSDLDIKVYGTKFNVNTTRENHIETLLIDGSVGLSSDSCIENEIMMSPKQFYSFDLVNKSGELINVNPSDFLGWIEGNFMCNSMPLSQLLNDISSWYGVTIDDKINANKEVVSVNISRDLDIEAILETLGNMCNVKFKKEGRNRYSINNLH